MSNARIQFSTASEEKWLQVNPVLREGELVIARKANGKRKLVVGKPGGSSYANSEVVWDAEQAETYMNTTKDLSENVNVFVPHIDSSGILTWTNKAGLDNPSPITIKGIKGDPGEKGEPGQRGEQGAQGIQGPRGIQGEQGERGVQGAQGPAGNAATITIGNVTTSAPGTAASVTNRGTPSAAVLDFVLPKGKDGADGGVTVDEELSSTSTNPVQNNVIYNALLNKVGTDIFSGFALLGGATNIRWREGTQFVGSINAVNYSGTARAATHDGAGNVITDTYAKKTDVSGMVKSVNNIKPDSNGNVTITVSGGSNVTVDTTLSATSTNPIANKTVYSALGGKLGKTETAYAATKATQDGNGNVISSTYIKSVNNVTPDENGNVAITVSGGGSNITVDAELSATSTNPVQNKVIKGALDDKADLNKNNTFSKENYFQKGMSLIAYRDLDSAIKWYQSTANPPIASIDATNYTGTAAKATSDSAGNIITETYAKKTDVSGVVKSVNGTKPDASGNVTVAVSGGGGGVSTSESNTWTAQQNFRDLMLNREKYTTYVVNGTSDTPVTSTMVYAVTGAFTLNLATLAGALSASQSSVFTAYFAANADYSLTISNAGNLKYTGSASDVAITTSGLLLNIWMSKDGGGTLTSIVQATKLS